MKWTLSVRFALLVALVPLTSAMLTNNDMDGLVKNLIHHEDHFERAIHSALDRASDEHTIDADLAGRLEKAVDIEMEGLEAEERDFMRGIDGTSFSEPCESCKARARKSGLRATVRRLLVECEGEDCE